MKNKAQLIYIYLLLLPFIDVITALMTRFTNFNLSLGMVIKGLTIVFGVIYIFFLSKSKWRKKSIFCLLLIMLFFAVYLLTKNEIFITGNYLKEITLAFRYFYFIVMLLIVMNLFDDVNVDQEKIKKIIFISSFVYAILMLIPIITGTSFASYPNPKMSGDNGWFYAANETGAITILLLLGTTYLLNNQKKYYLLGYIPILLAVALIGTKVSYLGMILAVITIVIFNLIKYKKAGRFNSIALFLMLLVICLFSPALANLMDVKARIDREEFHIDYKLEDFIHNKFLAKTIRLSLNGREDFFINDMLIYAKSDTKHHLFGLGWSGESNVPKLDDYQKTVEIDYIDVFFRYGIIGFIIYFMPFVYVLCYYFKRKKTTEANYYFTFLILGILISMVAGHVMVAPAVSIYLILIIYLMYKSLDIKPIDDEITIMALHLGHGGIEKYLSSLCKMLDDKYKINIIATYKVTEKPAYDFSDKITIAYLIDHEPNKQDLIRALKKKDIKNILKEGFKSIKILIQKRKLNIKAIKNIKSKYIITTRDFHNALVGEYANNNIIKIATEHNYHNNNKKYYKKVARSVRGFDYFVLVSNNLKEFYQNKVMGPVCVYIPNTIDNLPNTFTKLGNHNLISVGRLVKEKGFNDLIDVISLVKETIKDVKLYIIGDGPLRESLEKKIKNYHLEKDIILTGYASQALIGKQLTDTSLYVMTSLTESFGIVLLEAMSYKVPCIAFDSANGAKELLKYDVGMLIPNRDKTLMANTIIDLLNHQEKLKKYSENGYKKVKTYLIDNVKKEWLAILK